MMWAWAFTIAMAGTTADGPRVARVVVEAVDVLDEPDDAAYSTGRLGRGHRVEVRGEGPEGWAAILPPDGAFSLVEETDLEDLGDGRAGVIVPHATVRPGRDGARVPGPPRLTLARGMIVRLLDQRPLVVRDSLGKKNWVAIAPPRTEVRFVRADALADWPEGDAEAEPPSRRDALASSRANADGPTEPGPSRPKTPSLGPIDPDFASTGNAGDLSGLPGELATRMRGIASRHRSILRMPIDRWDLSAIEDEYRRLLREGLELPEKRVVEGRLDRVIRQRKAATAAKRLSDLVRESRDRDGKTTSHPDLGGPGDTDSEVGFDASGLLQLSARTVDGTKVFALFGDDGHVVCYLTFPPGLAVTPFLAKRVGVRGEGRFDEGLGARLIRVKDLDALIGRR